MFVKPFFEKQKNKRFLKRFLTVSASALGLTEENKSENQIGKNDVEGCDFELPEFSFC